ncbi:MAG: hypothetical protein PHS07_01220 [Patescibacteria group bacterium]|nr:hypothetical protein [Patescibacteria group bacterium]
MSIITFFKNKQRYIYLEYAVVALLILLPLLYTSGCIFALDMVSFSNFKMPNEISNGFPILTFLHWLNLILPGELIQKIMLFLIILLAGVGVHKLVPVKNNWARYFAGLLYIFNPFFYERFLIGHVWVLVAYALIPFIFKRFFIFLNQINFKNTLILSLWLVGLGMVSPHFLIIMFMILPIFGAGYLLKNKNQFKQFLKYSLIGLIIFLVLSLYWLIPTLTGQNQMGDLVRQKISQQDFEAFQTLGQGSQVLLNVWSLHGFWAEASQQFIVLKEVFKWWWIVFGIIFGLVVWGGITLKYRNRETEKQEKQKITEWVAWSLIITGVVAFILACGIAHSWTKPITEFLYKYVPFYRGMREPQKWVGVLVLVYVYLAGLGVDDIIQRFKKIKLDYLAGLFLIIPLLFSPLSLWGFRGQLFTSDYPQSWYEVNQLLNQDSPPHQNIDSGGIDDFKVLFLPWHQYMSFNFVKNKVIANPATNFFDQEIISGDNMELGSIQTHSQRPVSKFIENQVLVNKENIDNLGELLNDWQIKYVILAQEVDFLEYDFLNQQTDLEIIFQNLEIILYQNKNWTK